MQMTSHFTKSVEPDFAAWKESVSDMDQRVFSFGNPKKTICEARNCVVIKGRYQYFTTINRPLCACLNLL